MRSLFERLEQTKALGWARHRKIVQTTWTDSRSLLADIILEWCSTETVSYANVKLLLERICQIEADVLPLDQISAKLTFAFLASSNLDKGERFAHAQEVGGKCFVGKVNKYDLFIFCAERIAEVQGLYANIRNDNAWKNPRLAVVVQMCWAILFAKMPAQSQSLKKSTLSLLKTNIFSEYDIFRGN